LTTTPDRAIYHHMPLSAASLPTPAGQPPNKGTQITGKLRRALDAMVWSGLPRKAAAQAAGLTEHGLYKALRKQGVRAAYLAELEVLRTSERARNIHRAVEIRDAANNMPAMDAIKWLHKEDEQAQRTSGPSMPGFVIVLQQGDAPAVRVIEHERDIDGTRER